MKKYFSKIALPFQYSEYDLYYRQFVDTKEDLGVLLDRDVDNWTEANITHPVFSQIPDPNRVDYFNKAYGSDPAQVLDIHHLKGDKLKPVIIYIHGGGWIMGDQSDSRYAGPSWVASGYTVVSINYRLAPQNPHPAQIEDCAMALKWVIDNISNYGGDPNNIAIIGHSSGGHLTALLVTGTKWHHQFGIDISKVKCWIPMSGIHDFNLPENFYHPNMSLFCGSLLDDPEDKVDASPVNYITGNEPPCLIHHGGDDWLVPRSNSVELYNKLKEKGVQTELEITNNYLHIETIVFYGESADFKPGKVVDHYLEKVFPAK